MTPTLVDGIRRRRWRWIAFSLVVVGLCGVVTFAWGKQIAAVVDGDVLLQYEPKFSVPQTVGHVDAKVKVWNGGLSPLEIMGLGNPCPDCIKVEGVPQVIPPLQTREIKIHLPISHLPSGKAIPLRFRLLCNRPVATTEFEITLFRKSVPEDYRVPTPAQRTATTMSVTLQEQNGLK